MHYRKHSSSEKVTVLIYEFKCDTFSNNEDFRFCIKVLRAYKENSYFSSFYRFFYGKIQNVF